MICSHCMLLDTPRFGSKYTKKFMFDYYDLFSWNVDNFRRTNFHVLSENHIFFLIWTLYKHNQRDPEVWLTIAWRLPGHWTYCCILSQVRCVPWRLLRKTRTENSEILELRHRQPTIHRRLSAKKENQALCYGNDEVY